MSTTLPSIRQLLIDAVERGTNIGEAFQPETERIASYHRRPLTQRYAGLLMELAGKTPARHSFK